MGLGHVPAGALPEERPGPHLPRRERRGGRASRVQAARARRHLGRLGELVATRFLQRRGATLLARNVRSGPGEIDLLVFLGGHIVAVEVKTRVGQDPLLALTAEKERRLGEALSRLRPRPDRLDVVAVRFDAAGASIRWLRDVG